MARILPWKKNNPATPPEGSAKSPAKAPKASEFIAAITGAIVGQAPITPLQQNYPAAASPACDFNSQPRLTDTEVTTFRNFNNHLISFNSSFNAGYSSYTSSSSFIITSSNNDAFETASPCSQANQKSVFQCTFSPSKSLLLTSIVGLT